jgi:glycosyltransferase involved in cell wall biosynthesis
MTYRGLTVGVVVPAYDEEGYVGGVIDTLPECVDRAYVVDDCSTDDTWSEIRDHAREKNRERGGRYDDLVVPIRHEVNRGVGGAIKTGYLRARDEEIDVTLVLAGDGQMDPSELHRYVDPIADGVADYVKGDRFRRPEDSAAMPRVRLVGNVALSYLTKIASGYWQTMDSQNGYAAISLHALETAEIEEMYEYYGYCNDLLVRLNSAGLRVANVPRSSEFAYDDDWKSHIRLKEYVPRVSVMLFRGFLRRLWRKYLLADYSPIPLLYGLGGAAAGAGVLGLAGSLLDRDGDRASWVQAVTIGAFVFLYATLLDRDENSDLQYQVAPEDVAEGPSGEATSGDTEGASRFDVAEKRFVEGPAGDERSAQFENNGDTTGLESEEVTGDPAPEEGKRETSE